MKVHRLYLILALLVSGCGDDPANGPATADQYAAVLTISGLPGTGVTSLTVPLSGSQVVPPRGTTATGIAQIYIGKSTIDYSITLNNASGVTRAELYVGPPGESGTLAAVLYSSSPTSTVNGVLVDSALVAADIRNVSLDGLMRAIPDGDAYIQITTSSAPQGLLRGQTAPSGQAMLTLGSGAILVEIRTYLLNGITSATLDEGLPGRIGDTKFILFADSSGRDSVNGTLVSDVFHGDDIVDATSIDSLISLIRNEQTYINITTEDSPQGAIRGQLEAIE